MPISLDIALNVAAVAVPAVIAITTHEAAHGFVADRLGDDTARRLGRVTFNPLRHIDPVGTILLPAILLLVRSPFLFGWAKPVPVSFHRLRNPRRDMVLVAAAGPGINLALAVISSALLHVASPMAESPTGWIGLALVYSVQFNLMLAVFNMPNPLAIPLARLERYGLLIVLGLFLLLPYVGERLGYDLDPFGILIGVPLEWLQHVVMSITGH